ncbi:MAG: HD domain-containing protein [Clostridia bacterium]|nr:HD domain-containing protein [Clostridia bacterium]
MSAFEDYSNKALCMLKKSGYKAYFVGGCVRDFLLGRGVLDIDIATDALPDEIKKTFAEYTTVDCGIKHGTVKVVFNEGVCDITTFRKDGDYSDNRHPKKVSFVSELQEDLSRRDFTINAICMDEYGSIIDYFGGLKDLRAGIIRCVGDPDLRFREDALRIMRALRFASVLKFEIERETDAALRENAYRLNSISGERIFDELKKLLIGDGVKRVILDYPEVFATFIPEIMQSVGCEQFNEYHIYDVLEHTAVSVQSIEKDWRLRLVMLLHDLGKPFVIRVDANGCGHSYGHSARSCEIAERVLDRLKMSNSDKIYVLELIRFHNYKNLSGRVEVKRSLRKFGLKMFINLLKVQRADAMAKNRKLIITKDNYFGTLEEITSEVKRIEANNECYSLGRLAVNGDDLIEFGFVGGKKVGRILELLLSAVIADKCDNCKAALLEYAAKYKEN